MFYLSHLDSPQLGFQTYPIPFHRSLSPEAWKKPHFPLAIFLFWIRLVSTVDVALSTLISPYKPFLPQSTLSTSIEVRVPKGILLTCESPGKSCQKPDPEQVLREELLRLREVVPLLCTVLYIGSKLYAQQLCMLLC